MIILANVGTLYDGTSADAKTSVRRNVDLFIDKGKIAEIKPHDPRLSIGTAHTRIDCTGYTVTPGLIDCHNHLTTLGVSERDLDRMNGPAGMVWVEKILYATLVEGGVTTTRDVGGATLHVKRLIEDGVLIGPRLKIAICMLSTTGGHADFRGPDRCHASISKLWPPMEGRPSSIVDGPWEARKRVREIAACGADLIKICCSPGIASPGDKLEHREFSPEEIEAITSEARHRGLKVAAHAHSKAGIALAIDNGVSDIQHISFMDERLVERAHAKGCSVTPTSWVMTELTKVEGFNDLQKEKVRACAETHAAATRYAAKGGLKILAGSDPVLPGMHGRNYLEVQALIDEGLPALAAWHAATGLAADEVEQPDAGALVPGRRADLLLCKGDVLAAPRLLGEGGLVEVMKDGVCYRGAIKELPQRSYGSDLMAQLRAVTEKA